MHASWENFNHFPTTTSEWWNSGFCSVFHSSIAEPPEKEDTAGVVIGAILGVLLFLIIIGLIIFLVVRAKKKKQRMAYV